MTRKSSRCSEEYALHLATTLAAAWPRTKVSDETCILWARSFQAATEDVAEETVEALSRFEGPPTKRELEDALRSVRERLHPELPLEPRTTGRILTLEEFRHGHYHLLRFWATGETPDLRDPEEFERALKPWDCGCSDWQTWKAPEPRLGAIYEPLTL
jgi:hypothetical protein